MNATAITAAALAVVGIMAIRKAPQAGTPETPSTYAEQLIAEARKELGVTYSQVKPQGPAHWDCSGLIQGMHARLSLATPRQITEQAQQAPKKTDPMNFKSLDEMKAALKPGDCIGTGFQSNGRFKHGGIWTGTSVIHASFSRGKVVEDIGLSAYWFNERRMIYRYIP